MRSPAFRHPRAVVSHDRVLVAEPRAAQLDDACVHVEQVVETRGDEVAAERLEHERLDSEVAQGLVAARIRAQILDTRDLERWRRGVLLPDGPALPSAVRILKHGKSSTWLSVTFREGRYREVKRYCKALGHPVTRLRRVQFGPLRLGALPSGRTRSLTATELERLQNLLDQGASPILPEIR